MLMRYVDSYILYLVSFPSSRHRLSYDDHLEDKRENYENCSVLCMTVVHNGMRIHMRSCYRCVLV